MTDDAIKTGDLDHAAAGAETQTDTTGAAANDAGATAAAETTPPAPKAEEGADATAEKTAEAAPEKSAETEGEKVEEKVEGDALLVKAAIHGEILKLRDLVVKAKATHPWAYHVEAALVAALEHMTE